MKVGDLVTVAPAMTGMYVVVSTDAYDVHCGNHLPECIVLAVPECGGSLVMDKRFIRMISEA